MRFYLVLLLSGFFCQTMSKKLELVHDDKLVNMIRSVDRLVVLFSTNNCRKCDEYEHELTLIWRDLADELITWVVKLIDSSMTRLYTPNQEPAIVFFRHGIPLLYDGPADKGMIFDMVSNNLRPNVKELNDETFEHLTQAASGATTGDWFVQFYTTDCVECQRMQAKWEAVGAHLKSSINVAKVNRATTGAVTARRFDVFEVPTFILFKKGKMYKYHNQDFEIKSLVAFAQDWFKNMKPDVVPVPKTPFDELVAFTVTFMNDNPYLWQLALASMLLGLVISTVFKFLKKSGKKVEEKSTKSEKKNTSSKKTSKRE